MPRVGVIVFPGSNCDHDCYHVLREVCGVDCEYVWHAEAALAGFDLIVLPGGFSYGDYLRAGAIARFSPVLEPIRRFAEGGGLVLGICNGFQVLTESGLLPGALVRNASLRFVCRWVHLRVENTHTPFTHLIPEGTVLRIPIAHGDGRYFADPATLDELEASGGVAFRYTDPAGSPTEGANPNGSLLNIAGITNPAGNVLGMMPHPERCSEDALGGTDGLVIFRSVISWIMDGKSTAPFPGDGHAASRHS